MRVIDPVALVAQLKELFPDCCPAPDATDRSIWIGVGAVSVVRWIEQTYLPNGTDYEQPLDLESGPGRQPGADPRSWRA